MRSVVITGLGFITCIGNDQTAVTDRLRSGKSGLAPVEFLGNPRLPVRLAGAIKDFMTASANWRDWRYPAGYEVPRETLRSFSPHGLYALCAVEQALADGGLKAADARDGATGLFCASAGSAFLLHHHLAQMHAVQGERGNPLGVVASIAGTLNFNLAAHYGIRGAVGGFAAACASSSHALGCAMDEIGLGRQERMLVVGAEEVTAETVLPFAAMRALSSESDPKLASRPFDLGRDGFVASGGAVCLLLESREAAARRGVPLYAELLGWGQAADGYSVAMPHPEGAGLVESMRRALKAARIAAEHVSYVNAHATSTPAGDRAEALALRALFTERGLTPLVSSTKGLTGHPLSMSGIMEIAFCALAFRHGFIPGNAHLADPDPVCEGLNLPRETLLRRPEIILKNSSGFGGSNVSLVLSRP
jgi:3-oxoacyl-(acyl-carrier-protein) synthase